MGSGTNYVDGGANAGTTPVGRQGNGHAGRVRGELDGSQRGDGDATDQRHVWRADATAFNGWLHRQGHCGSETNYIKNIENVNVQIWNDANSNGQKDWGSEVTFGKSINLAMNVNEIKLDPNDSTKVQGGATLASQMHYAWANGGLGADTFSLSDISPVPHKH
jgi:hypothetical protein